MLGFEINLKEFNLGDILQFLARVKKTGVLRVEGRVSGEIYISEGLVVHATDSIEKGLEALLNLSFNELNRGRFELNVHAPERTISEDIGKLSEDIERRRVEYQEIKKNLPPMDTTLAKSTRELESAVALRRTDWQILALIDGKRTLNDVINQSKLGGYEATKTIVWLKEQGLIYDPKEAERIMSGMVDYLEVLFEAFAKIGLDWLRSWAELGPENKKVVDALAINEETLKIELRGQLSVEEIRGFFEKFDGYINKEAPKVYGKLLFKKKLEEFKRRLTERGESG